MGSMPPPVFVEVPQPDHDADLVAIELQEATAEPSTPAAPEPDGDAPSVVPVPGAITLARPRQAHPRAPRMPESPTSPQDPTRDTQAPEAEIHTAAVSEGVAPGRAREEPTTQTVPSVPEGAADSANEVLGAIDGPATEDGESAIASATPSTESGGAPIASADAATPTTLTQEECTDPLAGLWTRSHHYADDNTWTRETYEIIRTSAGLLAYLIAESWPGYDNDSTPPPCRTRVGIYRVIEGHLWDELRLSVRFRASIVERGDGSLMLHTTATESVEVSCGRLPSDFVPDSPVETIFTPDPRTGRLDYTSSWGRHHRVGSLRRVRCGR